MRWAAGGVWGRGGAVLATGGHAKGMKGGCPFSQGGARSRRLHWLMSPPSQGSVGRAPWSVAFSSITDVAATGDSSGNGRGATSAMDDDDDDNVVALRLALERADQSTCPVCGWVAPSTWPLLGARVEEQQQQYEEEAQLLMDTRLLAHVTLRHPVEATACLGAPRVGQLLASWLKVAARITTTNDLRCQRAAELAAPLRVTVVSDWPRCDRFALLQRHTLDTVAARAIGQGVEGQLVLGFCHPARIAQETDIVNTYVMEQGGPCAGLRSACATALPTFLLIPPFGPYVADHLATSLVDALTRIIYEWTDDPSPSSVTRPVTSMNDAPVAASRRRGLHLRLVVVGQPGLAYVLRGMSLSGRFSAAASLAAVGDGGTTVALTIDEVPSTAAEP